MFNKKWKNPGAHTEYDGLYTSWHNMHQRAGNKDGKNPTYSDVTVCERWNSYDNFFDDMSSTWFNGATIDKDSIKPGNRVYCPEYCCWMTRSDNDKERNARLGNPMNAPGAKERFLKSMKSFYESRKGTRNTHSFKKVKCVETGEIFECCVDAEKKYNTKKFAVSRAANPNEKQKTAAGYHWEYVEE